MTGVFTAIDNPNRVTLTGECASLDILQSFMGQPELKAEMEKAGVISEPEMKVLKKA
jgi:hypothetical protein